MTRSGAALAEIQEHAKATSQHVGMKTVVCGLKSRIRDSRLSDWMKEHAVHVGVWRHMVSLVANEVLLSFDEMPVRPPKCVYVAKSLRHWHPAHGFESTKTAKTRAMPSNAASATEMSWPA